QGPAEVALVLERLAVHGRDDVFWLDAGLLGRAAGLHVRDREPGLVRQPEAPRQGRAVRRRTDAKVGVVDLAGRDQLVGDLLGGVDRDREVDPLLSLRSQRRSRSQASRMTGSRAVRASTTATTPGTRAARRSASSWA